ncbi:NUDIX hydrolase [Sulfitobacter sp. LCG007]
MDHQAGRMLDTVSMSIAGIWQRIGADTQIGEAAALCLRRSKAGPRVLLVTCRRSGRWIVPQARVGEGEDAAETACHAAWRQAGVRASPERRMPLGIFDALRPCCADPNDVWRVHAFLVGVRRLADSYPQSADRERRWFTPQEAAQRVLEPGLKTILGRL